MARIRRHNAQSTVTKAMDMWRVGNYIRLSREDGNNESESVVNQRKIIDEFVESYFKEPYTVVDYYVDDGLSGTDDTREDYMRLMRDIEQGKVNCIVCKTLARAFRNYSDQGYYLEDYFQQKKVRFISIGDPRIDTHLNPDAVTGLEVPISGIMNDRFAARTSHDVRRTFDTKRRRGEFIGAFAPYGYLKDEHDKNQLVIDEEIAALKQEVLRWVLIDGISWIGAAKKLNTIGMPNPTAYKRSKGWKYQNPHAKDNDGLWCGTTVRRIMLDPVNLGHTVQGKQRVISYKVHHRENVPESEWYMVKGTHQPTFTQEEYDALMNVSLKDTRTAQGQHTVHLLAGFIRCADCKKAMRRKSSKGYVYYFCRTYQEKSKVHCTKHTIRESDLMVSLLVALQKQIQFLTSVKCIVDKINENPVVNTQSQRLEKRLQERKKELAKVHLISDDLYADWKTGVISRDDYMRMKVKYDDQIKALTEIIANLEDEQCHMDSALDSQNVLFTEFLKHGNIDSLNRGILTELVKEVRVSENKELTIEFRYADEFERVLELVRLNSELP